MNACVSPRRQLLKNAACGFGSLALAGILGNDRNQMLSRVHAADEPMSIQRAGKNPLAPKAPMFAPKAKRIIFIFMQGGPSHVDTFDYKPELIKRHETMIDFTGVRAKDFGKATKQKLYKPFWKFKPYGESGQMVSDLFPHIAQHVDDLCFLRGMHTDGVAHGPATLFMHTGSFSFVRPSIGSWITYGLGSVNQNMPAFVTIAPSQANGGPRNYGNAFLPAVYQGTTLGFAGQSQDSINIKNLKSSQSRQERMRQQKLLRQLNRQQMQAGGQDHELEAAIQSYELAFRMQSHAPEVLDLSGETRATREMYGLNQKHTEGFGRQCLTARRMAEAGVRYIQVNYADNSVNPRWDQHNNMPKHMDHARATDQPVAALLADLKQRGLLEDTLVWWGGEFGRTPFTQNKNGRDHNPRGFSIFLAGGGVKRGFSYGSTDEIGHHAVDGKVHMHDLHATVLHLLGMDHERLTYRYAGRDFRLTDVYGRVVEEIIA